MGGPILLGYGVLAVLGTALVAVGVYRRTRNFTIAGVAILLAIAGAWIAGPLGAAAGLLPLAFLRRGAGYTSK